MADSTSDRTDGDDGPGPNGIPSSTVAGDSVVKSNFHFSKLNLEQIRLLHSKFVLERDWHKFHSPRNILLALFGELGEISELFQWKSDQDSTTGLPKWSQKERQALADELADVLIYLIRLADRCQIDLSQTILN